MDIICRLCAIKGYLVTMICLFVVIINLPILEDEKFAIIAPHDCLPHALDILQNSVVERSIEEGGKRMTRSSPAGRTSVPEEACCRYCIDQSVVGAGKISTDANSALMAFLRRSNPLSDTNEVEAYMMPNVSLA